MRVNFVTLANDQIASYRYHAAIPARELGLLGHDTNITEFPAIDAHIHVFGKHFNYGDYWYMRGVQSKGRKVIFHCCDNHFYDSHESHYRRMLKEADTVIAPTKAMAAIIEKETSRFPIVIEDPYEFPKARPHFGNTLPLRVVWFGHQFNLMSLQNVLPLPDFCELRLVTRIEQPLPLIFNKIPYLPWSYENMIVALDWADVAILPVDLDKEYNTGRSANRLVEAARRGCFVVASPTEAYSEFKDLMYIGDIHDGLTWLRDRDKAEINERITKAQEYIEQRFAPEIIGKKWEAALGN